MGLGRILLAYTASVVLALFIVGVCDYAGLINIIATFINVFMNS